MTVSSGWHINESQLEDLFDNVPSDIKQLEKELCNIDIRKYGCPVLTDVNKDSIFIEGPLVLQISRYRNVSHPQISDHVQGGVVRLFLTDGHGSISALLFDDIKGLNNNTPPGTKLLLTGKIPIEGNFIILSKNNVTVLGGKVEALIEKWVIEKNALKGIGRKGQTSAPMWVSFGSKKGAKNAEPKNFKANDFINATGKKDQQEDDSFLKQRKENIESAVEDTTKKVFAAPKIAPPLVAKPAQPEREKPQKSIRAEKPKSGRRRKNSEDAEVPAEFARPSAPSTLFDFMSGGLLESATASPSMPSYQPKERTQNTRGSNYGGYATGNSGGFRGGGRPDQNRRGRNDRSKPMNDNRRPRGPPHANEPNVYQPEHGRKPTRPDSTRNNNRSNDNRMDVRFDRSTHVPNQGSSRQPKTNQLPHKEMPQRNPDHSGFPGIDDTIVHKMSNMHIGPPMTFTRSKPFLDKQNKRPGFGKNMPTWKVGQQCKAPWTDGGYYAATILSLGPADMCTVRYNDYGNVSTVPQAVLIYAMENTGHQA